jgi:phage gp36-like protein
MPYATQAVLIDRFGSLELIQLTDRSNVPPTTINATTVTRALADAEAVIDGYLRTRYALPLATTPPLLEGVACDLARFYLHSYVGSANAREDVKDGRAAALALLKDISTGRVTLTVAGVEQPTGGTVLVSGKAPIFSDDNLASFMGRF